MRAAATASAPAGIRIGAAGSVTARQTASATSLDCVVGVLVSRTEANTRSRNAAYGAGTSSPIRRRALSPKRVVGARPGSTRRARTSKGASSSASDSVKALIAALLPV